MPTFVASGKRPGSMAERIANHQQYGRPTTTGRGDSLAPAVEVAMRTAGTGTASASRAGTGGPASRRHKEDAHLLATRPPPDVEDNDAADGGLGRWDSALGNVEDARVALDTLSQAIEDAVYLDEDAYNQLLPAMQYTRVIQAQQRRIAEVEAELESLRTKLAETEAARKAAETLAGEQHQELENNAVVFKMHYGELMLKEDEIVRLKAVIEGLASEK